MRPGAPSRLSEAEAMAPILAEIYGSVQTIAGPGFIDGGDILVTEREILVGTSARTDSRGIEELRQIAAPWGYTVRELKPQKAFFISRRIALCWTKTPFFQPNAWQSLAVLNVIRSS